MMRRREFISLLGGAAVAWPLAARAQQAERSWNVGVLVGLREDDPDTQARLAGLRAGLEKLGWSEGRNIRIHYRFAPPRHSDPGIGEGISFPSTRCVAQPSVAGHTCVAGSDPNNPNRVRGRC